MVMEPLGSRKDFKLLKSKLFLDLGKTYSKQCKAEILIVSV